MGKLRANVRYDNNSLPVQITVYHGAKTPWVFEMNGSSVVYMGQERVSDRVVEFVQDLPFVQAVGGVNA